jgi:hypothetical protein
VQKLGEDREVFSHRKSATCQWSALRAKYVVPKSAKVSSPGGDKIIFIAGLAELRAVSQYILDRLNLKA